MKTLFRFERSGTRRLLPGALSIASLFSVMSLLLALTGCMLQDNKVAGGEDFPNTVQPLGIVASLGITDQSQYIYYTGGPKVPNVVKAADSANLVKPTGLLKRSSLADTLSGNLSLGGDTLQDYITVTPVADGSVKYTDVRASPGPDGDINTHQDNTYVSYVYAHLMGTDTLESLQLKDADGDGVFWGAGDSGTVEMDYWGKQIASRPLANSMSMTMLIRFYHDGDSATILSYKEQDLNKDGSVANYRASGVHRDSTIRLLNDTLLLTIDQTPGAGTSAPLSHSLFWISLGGLTKSSTDDSLLNYSIENTWSSGIIRHSLFQFTPVPRVVWKTVATTGDFTLSSSDSAGGTQDMTGTYQNGTTSVDLRETSNGNFSHYHVVYDSSGNVKQKTVILTN